MALNPTTRTYQMADADLIQRTDALLTSINRDSTDFDTRGVDAARIAQLSAARNTFSTYPTDEELAGALTVATEAKDTIRHDLEVAIRAIRSMASIQYGTTGLYKTFGFDDLTRQTDNDLVRVGRRVARVANTLLTDLTAQGLSAAQITNLQTTCGDFDLAIDDVAHAVETRDIQTQQRVTYGNAVFAALSQLASVGKSLYEDTNEAKYNDYIITDTPPQQDPPANP